jgi:hypothetical protein
MQFLVLPIHGFPIVQGDRCLGAMASFQPNQHRMCGIKVLYCEGTDAALVEETVMKAGSGVRSSCCVILTSERALMQLDCQPVSHDWHGYCVQCYITWLPSPNLAEVDEAACIISSKSPHHIMVVGEQLKRELGYVSGELIGRSLKFMQGPSTDLEAFRAMTDATHQCLAHETLLTVHRKDGSSLQIGLRLRPAVLHDQHGKHLVAICVHTVPPPPAEPCLATLISSLQLDAAATERKGDGAMEGRPRKPTSRAGRWDADAAAAQPARTAELAVLRPPQWADDMPRALAELRRDGLILDWEWSADSGAAAAAARGEAAEARARVVADVGRLRAAAVAADSGCPTGFLCAWLLALAEAAAVDAAAAAAAGSAGRGWAGQECGGGYADQATDMDFLLCTGP